MCEYLCQGPPRGQLGQFCRERVALGGAGMGVEVPAQRLPRGLVSRVAVVQLGQGHKPGIVTPRLLAVVDRDAPVSWGR